ncbi:hypothetical protein G9A89_008572 [Geosiphon pyriformis]|nr:hypothetical protein G9A89_008572 [Geosiphon pyriformis]
MGGSLRHRSVTNYDNDVEQINRNIIKKRLVLFRNAKKYFLVFVLAFFLWNAWVWYSSRPISRAKPADFTKALDNITSSVSPIKIEGLHLLFEARLDLRNLANRVERFSALNPITSQNLADTLRKFGDETFQIARQLEETRDKSEWFLAYFQSDIGIIRREIASKPDQQVSIRLVVQRLENILGRVQILETQVSKIKKTVTTAIESRLRADRLIIDARNEGETFIDKNKNWSLTRLFVGEKREVAKASEEGKFIEGAMNTLNVLAKNLENLDINLFRFHGRISDIMTTLKNSQEKENFDLLEFNDSHIEYLEMAVEKAKLGSMNFIVTIKGND